VEQAPIAAEEDTERVGNGENTVTVGDVEDFMCHDVCAFDVVAVATSGAKAGFTAEIDVVELIAMLTNKSGKAGFAAIDEFFNVFNDCIAKIYPAVQHLGKVVSKNFS